MSEPSPDDSPARTRTGGADRGRRSGYHDFEIEIGPGEGQEYPRAIINSPAGQARSTMLFPYDEVILESRSNRTPAAKSQTGPKQRRLVDPRDRREPRTCRSESGGSYSVPRVNWSVNAD